jgi:hypothetical protein
MQKAWKLEKCEIGHRGGEKPEKSSPIEAGEGW